MVVLLIWACLHARVPKSFTQWSKSSRYLVRVLRHSVLKHRSTSFTVNMHILYKCFYTFMYTHMSYATKFNHKNQDEIFSAFVCFLFIFLFCCQPCTKARFAGNDLATCRNSITDLARRSCCLQVVGGGIPETPMANTISGCPNRSYDLDVTSPPIAQVQMMATDVGLVVGKIPKKCIKTLPCRLGKMTIFLNLRVGVGTSPPQIMTYLNLKNHSGKRCDLGPSWAN